MKPTTEASAIEAYPHIRNRICMLWGTHDLDQYITHLMTDTRDGQRSGFPVEVTAELLFLAEINKLIRAIDLARKLQIPLREAYQKVDKQDRGADLGDPLDPLVARDSYAREEREIGVKPQPVTHIQHSEGSSGGLFAVVGKLAVVLVVLYLVWQFILPLFSK
ncbi:hypothetical protein [Sulfuricystis multivorans]|uniref:hypothetical protein n=1 Tax=Sulfuricystis multivorans TaxID=2211108 RepID=UPI000F84E1EC|nr:hypothetical protein [Sulfuricystis multivorans]